jgi:hypothetical protein
MDAEEEEEEVQNFRSLLIEYKFPKCLTDGVSERWKCRIVPHASEEKQMKTYTKRGTPFTVRRKIVSNISTQTNDTRPSLYNVTEESRFASLVFMFIAK